MSDLGSWGRSGTGWGPNVPPRPAPRPRPRVYPVRAPGSAGTAGMQTRRGSAPGEAASPRGAARDSPPEGASPGPLPSPASLTTSETTGIESLDWVCLTAFAPASLSAGLRQPLGAAEARRSSLGSRQSLSDSRDSAGSAPSPPPGGPC